MKRWLVSERRRDIGWSVNTSESNHCQRVAQFLLIIDAACLLKSVFSKIIHLESSRDSRSHKESRKNLRLFSHRGSHAMRPLSLSCRLWKLHSRRFSNWRYVDVLLYKILTRREFFCPAENYSNAIRSLLCHLRHCLLTKWSKPCRALQRAATSITVDTIDMNIGLNLSSHDLQGAARNLGQRRIKSCHVVPREELCVSFTFYT